MSLILLDIKLTEKNIDKEMGLFIDGHLHGIVWSSGKLDYEKLFAVFYDIKVMNAEAFAKGLEKCSLLTNLLGQNVENLMTMVAQKFKSLLKWTVRGSALVTLSDKKQSFTVPRRKQKCMENGLCNICKFLYVFIVFAFTTNLIISTRYDFS